ncbi:Similar to NOF: 120.7 kDa protein in NOF-FB transposable element (Drosophila melanogaster) [Cotesia congregata]|uniref:Similar to NOF: 120.7 kDa protein in NOF-FB transposable element (Drosophila melanogaster) n=1 Tax=Cotesia congregata TaxID=51543 RepID=A0A8J2HQH2_COTCN|nr:Similar to NOF: 120.7 kDa protein in NOF-FB transposable element (Drosophila melanogaster) [Cotesia congregata]
MGTIPPCHIPGWAKLEMRIFAKDSSICIDATGSLIRKFMDSKVINFKNTTVPIYQMLSEQHDSGTIGFWLNRWLRLGNLLPKEVVCDGASALLNAACMEFNKFSQTQQWMGGPGYGFWFLEACKKKPKKSSLESMELDYIDSLITSKRNNKTSSILSLNLVRSSKFFPLKFIDKYAINKIYVNATTAAAMTNMLKTSDPDMHVASDYQHNIDEVLLNTIGEVRSTLLNVIFTSLKISGETKSQDCEIKKESRAAL